MDRFISKKRKSTGQNIEATESTETKLALLASLYPSADLDVLIETLLISDGSVDEAAALLQGTNDGQNSRKRLKASPLKSTYQSSLGVFGGIQNQAAPKPLTKKGRTLHLYDPEDIAANTPCSIIHNFLPNDEANALLRELLTEAPTFRTEVFKLFDKTVQSPHTSAFYVDDWDHALMQRTDYLYNGSYLTDIRQSTPEMLKASHRVRSSVNSEIQKRIQAYYPQGKKLKFQSPKEWVPNTAFVNCYNGGQESVGYHSDQLTYLGPRAVIGSLSLGVAREFRVRKIVAHDGDPASHESETQGDDRADAQGQIAIHLPHNSLLVMHAEMQEEWKHSIAPARTVEPHSIAGNIRLNVTYRCYRDSFHPRHTPRCKCGIAAVLRCVQRRRENRGRYMWQCHLHFSPGKEGCSFFQWAEFDDDGEPPWAHKGSNG